MPDRNGLLESNACTITQLKQQFATECPPKIGSEIELGIIDRETKTPRNLFHKIVACLPPSVRERTQAEFLGAQIEFASQPHNYVIELAKELRDFEQASSKQASKYSADLAWQANFPYWEFDSAMLGQSSRGLELVDRLGLRAAQMATNSAHFHVSVPRNKAIEVIDSLQAYVPLFLALSANSPIHNGRPTGHMSHRGAALSNGFPVCGLSQPYGDWHSFGQRMTKLVATGRIRSPKDIYYFVRPTRYGTVELRCCDLPCSLDHVVVLAALYQTLVVGLMEGLVRFRPDHDFLRAEMHDAVSRGLGAQLSDHTGRRGTPMNWVEQLRYDLETIAIGLKTDSILAMATSVLEVDGAAEQLKDFENRRRISQLTVRNSAAVKRRRVFATGITATAACASGLVAGVLL